MAIWTTLVAFVRRGEMSMDEARKRDNYYRFVREASYIPNPRKYVLDAQPEELPPYVSILSVELSNLWRDYAERVRAGELGPYEAAQAYYDDVMA